MKNFDINISGTTDNKNPYFIDKKKAIEKWKKFFDEHPNIKSNLWVEDNEI